VGIQHLRDGGADVGYDRETRLWDPEAGPDPLVEPEWYSRGYLPHCDKPGAVQMLNFRLVDALPAHVVEAIAQDPTCRTDAERWERLQDYLDAGHGACYLRDPKVGALVENALLFFDAQRYRLIAWSVKPNHVHTIIETMPGHPLERVLHSWKSYTGSEANKIVGRQGRFWQVEYFDRYIRDARHLEAAIAYIEERNASPFSSAARRKREAGE
jgi:hypothetical protein